MTHTNNPEATEYLQRLPETVPSVILTYWPPVVVPGSEVQVSLEVEGEFSPGVTLKVELISETGEILMTPITITSPSVTEKFTIPEGFSEGTYCLQILYQNSVLDSTFLDVVKNKAYTEQMIKFAEGLVIEDQVLKAIKEGSYDKVIPLQEQVVQNYKAANDIEIAALSWEELGEALFKVNKLELSQRALEESLSIYSEIEGLEDKESILVRIREEIAICKKGMKQPQLRSKKNP